MEKTLKSFKGYYKESGKLAMVVIVPKSYTAADLNSLMKLNVVFVDERSDLVDKIFVD